MPYPPKTDREAILASAVEQVVSKGINNLSLRGLAASLNIAPNALYRYFPNRAQLENAVADESARRLHQLLRRAVGKKAPADSIRSMARAYLKFAREQPALYQSMMTPDAEPAEACCAHDELWLFVVDQVARIADKSAAPDAAVVLWAFLHGMAGLQAAQVLGDAKPGTAFAFGIMAWLTGVAQTNRTSVL